jgi:hypothetical protein
MTSPPAVSNHIFLGGSDGPVKEYPTMLTTRPKIKMAAAKIFSALLNILSYFRIEICEKLIKG